MAIIYWIFPKPLTQAGIDLADVFAGGAPEFVNGGGSRKQADATWRPAAHMGISSWPGLVLEVGYSETLLMLRRDAKWWLESSPTIALPDGSHKAAVEQVIIVKVDREAVTLTIESWVLSATTRPTRNMGNRCGIATNKHPTTILTTSLRDGNTITEISGPATFSIRWDSLFDQTPRLGESDIILDTAALKYMANTFWAQLGLGLLQ